MAQPPPIAFLPHPSGPFCVGPHMPVSPCLAPGRRGTICKQLIKHKGRASVDSSSVGGWVLEGHREGPGSGGLVVRELWQGGGAPGGQGHCRARGCLRAEWPPGAAVGPRPRAPAPLRCSLYPPTPRVPHFLCWSPQPPSPVSPPWRALPLRRSPCPSGGPGQFCATLPALDRGGVLPSGPSLAPLCVPCPVPALCC